jgi:hypothetical protein
MPNIVKLTSPEGIVYYASRADSEGLRYRMKNPEDAERFNSLQSIEQAITELKQIRELQSYHYEIQEHTAN